MTRQFSYIVVVIFKIGKNSFILQMISETKKH
jgi:hypothetical protein